MASLKAQKLMVRTLNGMTAGHDRFGNSVLFNDDYDNPKFEWDLIVKELLNGRFVRRRNCGKKCGVAVISALGVELKTSNFHEAVDALKHQFLCPHCHQVFIPEKFHTPKDG